jgi:hypothetical protein
MSEQQTPDQRGVIQFGRKELDPEEEKAYREKIQAARQGVNQLKGNTPLGHVPKLSGVPVLSKEQAQQASGLQADGSVAPRPPGSPVLSQQTREQLEAMQKAQESTPLDEGEVKKEAEKLQDDDVFDVFDFAGRNEAERVLNNKKRRKEIESRCEPMKLEDLIYKDEVTQVVPVVPEKFEPRFRSFTPEESLFIKQFLSRDTAKDNDQYLLEKYSLCQLAVSLVDINGKALPDHRNKDGEIEDAAFKAKLKTILKKSAYVVADLMVNYAWFDIRVRKLLNPDDLKNG